MLGRVYSHASSSPLLPGCDKQASPRMKHEFVSIMACPDWFFSMLSMYKSCWGRASRCFQCEKPRLPVDFLVSTAIGSRMDQIGTWFNFLDTSKTSLWVNKNEKKHDWEWWFHEFQLTVPVLETMLQQVSQEWRFGTGRSCDEMGDSSSVLMPTPFEGQCGKKPFP